MIPAFGVLEIYRIPVVCILDIWVSQVCESNWALSDFRYGYVSDLFGFPAICTFGILRSNWGLDSDGTSPDGK